ncbi:unannotated protein [freshwater metagenome]|uniref:Unannotated protein n=1 Tax=freshwater metagenome TaxID=449393 RepID=A0A6J7S616_9ZZZZ
MSVGPAAGDQIIAAPEPAVVPAPLCVPSFTAIVDPLIVIVDFVPVSPKVRFAAT